MTNNTNSLKKKVLIVDDEYVFTDLLKLNLERKGNCEVYCENDSAHALESAHLFHPDIIFLDIVMPGPDGGEVASKLHDDPEFESTPVVFITALLDNHETRGGIIRNQHGEQLIAKPVRMDTVCRCLDRNFPN